MSDSAENLLSMQPPPGFDPRDIAPQPLAEEDWRVCSVALDVSGRCNLSCHYCVEARTMPARPRMDLETARRAVGWLLQECGDSQFSIRFGSGEPLLAFPLLKEIAKMAATLARSSGAGPPEFYLTTNGTLVDEEKAQWLAASGWYVKISLDGPPSIHDAVRIRPGGAQTSTDVISAVERLTLLMRDRTSVTAVLVPGADPGEAFSFIESLGVREIELLPVVGRQRHQLPAPADLEKYQAFLSGYVKDLLAGRTRAVLTRFVNKIPRAMGYDTLRIRCGAGRTLYGVGSAGGLYPCFRFVGRDEYRLGQLSRGWDPKAIAAFRRGAGRACDARNDCASCWASFLCGGPCFAVSELLDLPVGPDSIDCAYTRADAAAALEFVLSLQSSDPERLLSYLPVDTALGQ